MVRKVNEEIPVFSYDDEKKNVSSLFLLEGADSTAQGKAGESACAQEWENVEMKEDVSMEQPPDCAYAGQESY